MTRATLLGLCMAVLIGPGAQWVNAQDSRLDTNPMPLNQSLPSLGSPASQALSPGEEARIGQEMMREVRGALDWVEDPAINAYIRDLGARIAAATSMPAAHYQFFVIDDPRINAFAMPGGYIGIHSGLITASRTESELGAVVAHELSHVTQRHIAERIAAAQGTNLRTAAMVLAGLLISSQNPQAGMAAATSGMASGIDSQLAYSREHEREADRQGMRILANASLNPQGMPDFFNVLNDDSRYRRTPPPFLSTHPLTEARIADARAIANQLQPKTPFESPDYVYVRARAQVLGADNLNDTLAAFQARMASDPSAGERYGLALALIQTGSPERGAAHLNALRKANGENGLLHLGLAEASLAQGQVDTAIEQLEQGLSLFPDQTALRYQQVEAFLQANANAKAVALTRTLTHEQPDAAEIWALHAKTSSQAGDQTESAIAMAHYYAVQGDLEAGLSQLRQVDSDTASASQWARAEALRARWERRLTTAS